MGIGSYCLLMLYGVLPWFAFLPPGMRHAIRQFRKKEEFSIIVLSVFIAGLLSMSLVPQFVFALLIAKQVKGFFHEKFPYHRLVKVGAIIQLLVIVVGAMLLMVGGWQEMKGIGFRTMMVFGTIFWFTTFAFVIGIYGKNRRMIMGSAAICGLFTTFLFWGQVFPLLIEMDMF